VSVRRGSIAFTSLVLLGLVVGTYACTFEPEEAEDSTSPSAEATHARRTAEAEVQRIIAAHPPPTVTPQPTPSAVPTCRNAIWWYEARDHLGESRPVQGRVVHSRAAPNGTVLLEIGQAFPDPLALGVLVPADSAPSLTDKMLCVSGSIVSAQGAPTIEVRNPASIIVVE
jgi:hypothetical protein